MSFGRKIKRPREIGFPRVNAENNDKNVLDKIQAEIIKLNKLLKVMNAGLSVISRRKRVYMCLGGNIRSTNAFNVRTQCPRVIYEPRKNRNYKTIA